MTVDPVQRQALRDAQIRSARADRIARMAVVMIRAELARVALANSIRGPKP